ncbi:MAG: hypothetical protein GY770_22255 [Aestuariibacter sp.]|nr:hypothetical protein [Aestuariibacter sp.]
MATKNVTISARIPHVDAEFISQFQVAGAATPSDKLRAIIEEVRRRHQGKQDYRGCLNLVQDMIGSVSTNIREQEHTQQMHSEMVTRLMDWLPETMAFIMSSVNTTQDDQNGDPLIGLEDGIADRVFRLIESVLQMGITQRSPCYNVNIIQQRVEPILDLTKVIRIAHQQ